VIDVSNFIPDSWAQYYVGGDAFSTVIAWNTKTYGDKGPQSWADFWDVKQFPGTRSYRNTVTLEPALIADGVPMDQVYKVLSAPGGIERAIKKMEELKAHIAVWWSSGAQSAQLMVDGAVDMIMGWNGRFDVAKQSGAKVAYTFNQGMLDYDCYVVPKGAPNKDLAMKFVAEISKPQYQAGLTKFITYGPTNKKAYDDGIIPADYAATLPSSPANVAKQFGIDDGWYMKFDQQAAQAYQNMMTK
jgi:putative spermidine/putrescine transport system substrate-binding protein